jgi:WD40 repeat protein
MDFTDAYRLTPSSSSHRPFAYSTGSTFFATLHNLADEDSTVVQVRVSSTLQIVRTWTLDFQAVSISWSKSGALLLIVGRKEWIVLSVDPAAGQRVGSDSRGIVARVVVGMEGLANAMWVGHGNFEAVCVFSADDTLAHIYDIQRHTVLSFANPKRTKAFTSSLSNHVGLLTRQNGKDCLEIITSPSHRYSAEWKAEEHLILHTNDAVEAVWSPNERYIAVREGLLEYKVHIYSPLGHLQAIFQIDSNPISTAPSFQTLYSISTTESAKVAGDGLGIRDMKWSPNGCVLALGGYDENVRILESSEWTMIACLDLSQKLITECRDGAIGPLVRREGTADGA